VPSWRPVLFRGCHSAGAGRGAAPRRAQWRRQVEPDPHPRRTAAPFAGTVERRGALALADERPALDLHLPLGRALGSGAFDGPRRTLDRALATLGLDDLLDVPVRYLSTGQRKRAVLARTLLWRRAAVAARRAAQRARHRSARAVEGLVATHCAAAGSR
jgi:heme exporter protein A